MKLLLAFSFLAVASATPPPPEDGLPADNTEWHMCEARAVPGYRPFCPRGKPGDVCVPEPTCAPGYQLVGGTRAMGKFVCDDGYWQGSFKNCERTADAVEARCANPYTQTGYMMGPECRYGAAGGTACSAMCADGFYGTPSTTIACIDGEWVGHLRGCTSPCMLPSSVCTPGKGIDYKYRVRTLSPSHHVNKTSCMVHAMSMAMMPSSELVQVRLDCRRGYFAHSAENSIGDAICMDGALTGGFMVDSPAYDCKPYGESDSPCACGNRNEKRPSVRVRGGKFSFAETTPVTDGELRCWQVGKQISCTCKCTHALPALPPPPAAYKPCDTAHPQYPGADYEVVSCSEESPNSRCSVKCTGIPGSCGKVTGELLCATSDGAVVSNTLGGCAACACPLPYTQPGYMVSGCPADSPSGTVCAGMCAPGFSASAAITGGPTCEAGEWAGTEPTFGGCEPDACAISYMQHGYNSASSCMGPAMHGTTCMSEGTCPMGYEGTPSGSVRCQFGQWVGVGFMGCMPMKGTCDVAEAGKPGYSPKGRGLVPTGTTLLASEFMCGDGLGGTISGAVECTGDRWVETTALTGCVAQACVAASATEGNRYTVSAVVDGMVSATGCEPPYEQADPMVAPSGTKTCMNGHLMGSFEGCVLPETAADCATPYTQADAANYILRGCGAGAPSGQRCEAVRCADGFSGWPMGYAKCVDDAWWAPGSPAFTGCSTTRMGCPAYNVVGYAQCAEAADGGICNAACAAGYTAGTVAGSMTCQDGEWQTTTPFSGCTPTACSAFVPTASTPAGYDVSGCDAGTVGGTSCSVTCATGYCGMPMGAVTCVTEMGGSVYKGDAKLSGCEPCDCPVPYMQAGYESTNCGKNTPSGTSCMFTCAAGWSGTAATNEVSCNMGMYSGMATGCTPTACAGPYDQTDYVITGCGADSPHGTKCQATCAGSLCGKITGIVRCNAGQWEGAFSGCAACCSDPYTAGTGYLDAGCAGPVAVGTECQAACKYGYCGAAVGSVMCEMGATMPSYTGSFTGCSPCSCLDPFMQPGYQVTGCPADTAHGAVCSSSMCEAGYEGTPVAPTETVSCQFGEYKNMFSGCTPQACAAAYTQSGATVSRCGPNTPHGRICTAVCSSDGTTQPSGTVMCEKGAYTGTFDVASCPV